MRKYVDKKNVQKKSYYNDRYYLSPQAPKAEAATDELFANDMELLTQRFSVNEAYIQLGHLVVMIDAKMNRDVLCFLKDELGYEMMMEMSAMDWLADRGEYEIFYEMLNVNTGKRLRLKMFLNKDHAIETVSDVFRSADWSEREMYDMLGVKVNNHPYMKRLLMPDDWEGHPLLKTYPLQGDEFASWYEVDKIFGKEARDTIGPELRDAAMIDRYDTERFARLGHEVNFGTEVNAENESSTEKRYQEDGGVFLIKKLDPSKTKTLNEQERKR
jgi:NADH-quinone oxidoreductase subunit C